MTEIDTAVIRAEAMRGDALQMDVVALCDALDRARAELNHCCGWNLPEGSVESGMAILEAERDALKAAVERVRTILRNSDSDEVSGFDIETALADPQPAAPPQRCPTYDPATDECSCWKPEP